MNGRFKRSWVVAIALTVVAACGSGPTPSPASPAASPSVAPSTLASDEPGSSDDPTPGADEEAISHAIGQRKQFGLRSDEAWVRQVAADPRARTQLLDFPMLPEEEAEFERRQTSFEKVAGVVSEYGAGHPDEFGGVWIDQERHTVVAAWTRNAELHRLAILAQLGAAGPLDVRLVRYSERELNALTERLFEDTAWYATIEAAPLGGGAMIMTNRVELSISSANPQAAALILAHFGVAPDMLEVYSDGTGIALLPRGMLELTILTAAGGEPGPNGLDVAWTPDHRDGRDCGEMVGYAIPADGRLSIPCAPGGWTITIKAPKGDAWIPVGSGHAVVPPGGSADLEIRLEEGAGLNP